MSRTFGTAQLRAVRKGKRMELFIKIVIIVIALPFAMFFGAVLSVVLEDMVQAIRRKK